MAKIRYSAEEVEIAMTALMQELEIGNSRHVGFQRLFIAGPGRVFLRDWSRQDLIDPSVVHIGPTPVFVDGFLWGVSEPNLRVKWLQRAAYYVRNHLDQLIHVIDWLDVAATHEHHWTTVVDECGRPKKLAKCGSLAALVAEADKQMRRALANSGKREPLPEDHEKVVLSIGDDYAIVRLLTPAALDRESAEMRHCIGLGAYDRKLDLPGYKYYSVRDGRNCSLATLEIVDGVIKQYSGRCNSRPAPEIDHVIDSVRRQLGWITESENAKFSHFWEHSEMTLADIGRIGAVLMRGRQTRVERHAHAIEEMNRSLSSGSEDRQP